MTGDPAATGRSILGAARPYFGVFLLAVAFLLGAGSWCLFHMPSGIYPEVAFPRIVVIAGVPGLAIESVEVGVTRNLEKALSTVLGVARVHSKTLRGASEISVDFAPGTDMVQALNDVRARIAEIGPTLPPLESLVVERQTPSVFPIISVVVSGNRSPADLRDYATYDLQPRLSRLPDVSYVTVQGGDVREVLVEVDPVALAAAHLAVDDLAKEVGRSARLQAVGRQDQGRLQYQVMADTFVERQEALEDLVLSGQDGEPLRLGAVALTVFRRLGGSALTVSRALSAVLAEAARNAPAGIRVRTSYDQADLVRTSLANVRDAILVGGLFSVLTLFAFLRSIRGTLIAVVSIPTTLIISFFFLRLSGDTLNLMSLGGLAIAIGLVIDDTVVVIENIARHLEGGAGGAAAVEGASREIAAAVIGSTLTTVLVFVPLAFLHGVYGQFFWSLCLSLGIAVLVSLAISLTVIPILAARFLAGRPMPRPGRLYERAADLYEAALRAGLRWPKLSLALALLVVVPAVLIYGRLEQGVMPEMEEGAFVLDYWMPVGTSLAETDRTMRKVDAILHDTPEIARYLRRTGAELGFFATEPFRGDILVSLRPDAGRPLEEVMEDVRSTVKARVPEIETVECKPLIADQLNDMKGIEGTIEVKVFGPDYAVLRDIASTIGTRIEKIPGLKDLDTHVRQGNPDLVVRTDSAAARRAGLAAEAIDAQVEAGLYGRVAFTLPQVDRLTAVRVRYPDRVRFDVEALARLPIAAPAGESVPLGGVATISEERSMNERARENQQPMINVTADIEGGHDLGGVTRAIRAALAGLPVPRGYRWELAGDYRTQQEAFANFLAVLVVAVALVYLFLAIQFRSLLLPIPIFLTQPLSLTCALAALWITGTPLNVSSFMGFILLVGLDVKNGILLIDLIGQLRKAGVPLAGALVRAGRARFRPILMTSLATILGLLPLALGLGPGAQMQRPLAIAVIGGLAANMVFTRLIIPVGYELLVRGDRAPAIPADGPAGA